MERIQALISKLKEQHERNAPGSEMLVTVQQLHQELLAKSSPVSPRTLGTSKVSVVMPANMSADTFNKYAPQPREERQVATAEKTVVTESKPETETVLVDEGTLSIVQENGQLDMVFDPLQEIPTLSQQVKGPDRNGESLNDKLKQGKTELLEFLKESPVKDLRKAIGINDRFSFINELFRGDEAMYERSIKTINGFNIFPEAEYWITRELKTKLGWNPENEIVLNFDQLVKRRFSAT
ncbi:MAG: hypothetical protein EOO05_17665 [Chitinophagaceae bacterium]|nr:MAG: hypothetical protein EOO05_17665 [Chitinophagaceae bacterium]